MHSYKILIISRSFAPDSIVAAIRPTQMAKYLSLYGHHVTVIRSGRIVGKGNKENMEGLGKVTIFSYDDNSDAEKIEKGITLFEKNQGDKSNNHNVALQRLKKVLHTIYDPIHFYIQDCYVLKNRIMKLYRKNKIIRNYRRNNI